MTRADLVKILTPSELAEYDSIMAQVQVTVDELLKQLVKPFLEKIEAKYKLKK